MKNNTMASYLLAWIDARFPLSVFLRTQLLEYYAPKNFNFWYFFGILSLFVLVLQFVTGMFLVMHYKPDASLNAYGIPIAFASVEYIMREVPWGWLIRYMHSTGASMFFVVIYLHMFRGLLYGSYRAPRELIWIFGMMIFLCLMGEAFFGYLLPWGQMSFWGAQVIVNLFSAIPVIGPDLSIWIRGDFVVSDATLNRFFAFHVIAIPFVLIGLVVMHLVALREVGSNNPDGIEIKKNKGPDGIPLDGIPFHPYYIVKDCVGVVLFLIVYFSIIFFAPEVGGYFLEANNFLPADPLKTPEHIAPVWYFMPFYSMLRATTADFIPILGVAISVFLGIAYTVTRDWFVRIFFTVIWVLMLFGFYVIDAKFWGVVLMGGAVVILFFLPWLDRSMVKSIRYRPFWHFYLLCFFVVVFIILGVLGALPPSPVAQRIAQCCTLFYFSFFLTMPLWSRLGSCRPVPERLTMA